MCVNSTRGGPVAGCCRVIRVGAQEAHALMAHTLILGSMGETEGE